MRTLVKNGWLPLVLFALSGAMQAQEVGANPEMADTFYSEGKIYIVIAVLSMVLVGIFVYLFSMERKLKRLEEQLKQK